MDQQNQSSQMGGQTPVQATPVNKFDPKDIEANKLMAALSYIGILCLIPLLAKKDSPFAQEHGKQGFVLFLFAIALWVVGMIPFLGWIIWFAGWIFTVVVSFMGIFKALKGEFWEIPVLGQYRKMVNF